MSRPLSFAFTALEVGFAARAGLCGAGHRLRLATAALDPDVDDDGRAAARVFLATAAGGDVRGAGAALLDWVQRHVPVPPPTEFDWQKRKDLA